MVRNEMEFIGLDELVDFDHYSELLRAKAEYVGFGDELRGNATQMEEDNGIEVDYKTFLDTLIKGAKAKSLEKRSTKSLKKQRERDNDDDVREHDSDCGSEEANDPQYELFLKSLRAHEKSYVIEVVRNGLPFIIKYEGDESSDKERDLDHKRKLRSAAKQNIGPSIKCKSEPQSISSKETENLSRGKLRSATRQDIGPSIKCKNEPQSISSKETENLSRGKLRSRPHKSEKVENVNISTLGIQSDPDYRTFLKTVKVVDDHLVYEYGGTTTVYETSDGRGNIKQEEGGDESSDDVEILDSATFYKMNKDSDVNLSSPEAQSDFRNQLISVLRKPFNKEEYNQLYLNIQLRKPEQRHIDLRYGRERSFPKGNYGKSLLDRHSDLKRRLFQFQDDEPKRLNILRGFFFWFEKCAMNGSFRPWLDDECLAIMPESG